MIKQEIFRRMMKLNLRVAEIKDSKTPTKNNMFHTCLLITWGMLSVRTANQYKLSK